MLVIEGERRGSRGMSIGRRGSDGQSRRGSSEEDRNFAQSFLRRLSRFNPFSKTSIRNQAANNRRPTGDTTSRTSMGMSLSLAPSSINSSQYFDSESSIISTSNGAASTITIPPDSPLPEPEISGSQPVQPFGPREEPRELTPLEKRIEMRKLFMGRNLHDHIITMQNQYGSKEPKRQPFRSGVNSHSNSLPYKAGTRNSMDPAERLLFGIPGKGKHFVYGMDEDVHRDTMVDSTQNPYDLGYIEAPVRKWYQPIYAWYGNYFQ